MSNTLIEENFVFAKINRILFCLLPIAIISGPFFSDLIVSLIGILAIYIIIRNKKIKFFYNKYIIIFFLFYLYLLARSIFSNNVLLSLESSLFYFRFIFFVFGSAYLIYLYPKTILYFKYILFISISILVIDSYYQYFTGANIMGFVAAEEGRVSSFFDDELILGHYLCRMMPILFGLIAISKEISNKEILFSMILFLATDVLIFISGDRTAFVLLFISTILILAFIKRFKLVRLFTFLISILLIIFITLSDNTVKNRVIDSTIVQMSNDSDSRIVAFSSTHEAIFVTSWKMFLDNPIFGQGPKLFRDVCDDEKFLYKNGCSTHPHNSYFQLLAETGIIGFSFLVFSFLFVISKFVNHLLSYFLSHNKRMEDYEVCFYSALFIFLWPLAPSFNFFNNWITIIHFLPLCFLIDREKFKKFFT